MQSIGDVMKSRGFQSLFTPISESLKQCEKHGIAYAEKVFWVPRTTPTLMMPLVTVVPLQIFASELARVKGYDVDKPRNLAKSVTVE